MNTNNNETNNQEQQNNTTQQNQQQTTQNQSGISITESTKATVQNIKDSVTNILSDVNDVSSTFSNEDIKEGKVMGILSYIGFLVLVPFFFETSNQFVVYHAKQGMNLFIYGFGTAIVIGLLSFILTFLIPIMGVLLSSILWLAHLGFFGGLMAIGIVNVCNNQAKELPIINKIKIIK